jgi:hypothetical protein
MVQENDNASLFSRNTTTRTYSLTKMIRIAQWASVDTTEDAFTFEAIGFIVIRVVFLFTVTAAIQQLDDAFVMIACHGCQRREHVTNKFAIVVGSPIRLYEPAAGIKIVECRFHTMTTGAILCCETLATLTRLIKKRIPCLGLMLVFARKHCDHSFHERSESPCLNGRTRNCHCSR